MKLKKANFEKLQYLNIIGFDNASNIGNLNFRELKNLSLSLEIGHTLKEVSFEKLEFLDINGERMPKINCMKLKEMKCWLWL